MDLANITSFVLGLVAGVVAFALFLPWLNKRLKTRHEADLAQHEVMIGELRLERSEDRETNRRLRHELAVSTPNNFETTREERDIAVEEISRLQHQLQERSVELAARDRSLREARLAIHDIRVQLERDRFAAEGTAARFEEAMDDGSDLAPDLDLDGDLDGDAESAIDLDLDDDQRLEAQTLDPTELLPDEEIEPEAEWAASEDDPESSSVFFGGNPLGGAPTS